MFQPHPPPSTSNQWGNFRSWCSQSCSSTDAQFDAGHLWQTGELSSNFAWVLSSSEYWWIQIFFGFIFLQFQLGAFGLTLMPTLLMLHSSLPSCNFTRLVQNELKSYRPSYFWGGQYLVKLWHTKAEFDCRYAQYCSPCSSVSFSNFDNRDSAKIHGDKFTRGHRIPSYPTRFFGSNQVKI